MTPPSPLLSARMISTTYLSDTTIISAQKIVDMPPRMLAALSAMPWSGEKVSFTAYRGLVPMSPNTTPSAASVSAACDERFERGSRSNYGFADFSSGASRSLSGSPDAPAPEGSGAGRRK